MLNNTISKWAVSLALAAALAAGSVFAGGATSKKTPITVISREEGSGTRTAFVEILGIVDSGKNDAVTQSAEITNNTAVMIASVAGDTGAIGYISMGALNDTVKALKIDGISPSAADVKSGAYKIARPFNIVTREHLSTAARHFINFILSDEGQAIVAQNGYLPLDAADAAIPERPPAPLSGGGGAKIVVAGSSSVSPLMEKLREAYIGKYSGISIEIQQSDSSTGINSTISGICDIGMASRELRMSETEKGATSAAIATDGIAVIVNRGNPFDALSREQVKNIYLGNITDWDELE
jgi:phosphate transport system substrate-binding protein